MSVSITPGATALTRIPRGPRIAAKFLTRVSIAPLVEAYARIERLSRSGLPTTVRAAREEIKTMFEPCPRMGRTCRIRKNGLRTLADPRVAHKHVQSLAADRANLFCQRYCTIRSCQVRSDRLRPPAFCTDAVDQRFRLLRGAAIMEEDMRPGRRKRRCCRATNSP